MSLKGKSPAIAETSCAVASDSDSDIEALPVINMKKRPAIVETSQVHPTTVAKLKEAKAQFEAKGKQPAKKKKKLDTVDESGALIPAMALKFPDSEANQMDRPILCRLKMGECG